MTDRTPTPAAKPLHPDPAIAAALEFEPVLRKVKRPDGWAPDLQREFIRLLAETGSPQAACTAMGKNVTGIEALYKAPPADSFRAAWDQAVQIGRTAQGLDCGPPHRGPVPGIQRRPPRGVPPPAGGRGRGWEEPEDEPEISEEQKLELLERIANKFLRKVACEREARLRGEIVAADFYLRHITALETAFDLSSTELGFDANEVLRSIRLGEHGLLDIVDTPFVQYLDAKRREYWASDPSEPLRPITLREEFLTDHGDHRTTVDQHSYGAMTPPARGYSEEQWAAMGFEAQRSAREKQFEEDAAEQVAWEAKARREYDDRRASDTSP